MNREVISRIKKLLALGESSNEHEAKVAMLKAQELLVRHKLSMVEINAYKDTHKNISELKSNVSFLKAKWKSKLAYIIAENFGCYRYFRNKHNSQAIIFFGREEDIVVCNIVLEYAVDCISNTVRRLRNKYKREGYSTRGLEEDYALGFIEGLSTAFERQKEQNQEWGLILVKDKAVVEAYGNIKFKRTIDTSTKFNGFSDVYSSGVEDGENFSISDKIAREGEEVLQIDV